MKKLFKFMFSRLFLVAIALLVQIIWIIFIVYKVSIYSGFIRGFIVILCGVVVLRIINKWNNPSYMLPWAIVILVFPVFGITLYALFGRAGLTKGNREKFGAIHETLCKELPGDSLVVNRLEEDDTSYACQSKYINDMAGYPAYINTSTKYYPSGEDMFVDMIEDLKSAKHYIFLEFFIVAKGVMWDTILDILKEKAKQGVDVRVIYDDVGCISLLPAGYYKELSKMGIKCAAFNPFVPIVSVVMNNRDHRKILVVDGHTAYTGGVNLADEYINEIGRFGYWKDTGIKLKGEAVWSFTIMFLEMWSYITKNMETDLNSYKVEKYLESYPSTDGIIQPYSDSPLDMENVGENVYLNIISKASDYVYIYTPYLIIDNEMVTALCLAAKSGVDVKIITPGVPDKKYVYLLTQSYYERLLEAGVEIYQYTPGFVHAKCFVADDTVATVGTINLDYRSLVMHFECGVWMYKSSSVMDVKKDFEEALKVSEKITIEFCKSRPLLLRMLQGLLRVVAPLF